METEKLRQKTLDVARRHKTSWIELGQYLFSIYKDKLYKNWGFLDFEIYCRKELSIKETTAAKLLKSYHFLENEEPRLVLAPANEEVSPRVIPNYESVNLLRLAKQNKNLTTEDFADLRASVLTACKEPKEIRAQVKKIVAEREDRDPAEEKRSKRNSLIKRLVGLLSSAKKEFESQSLLPAYLLKQMSDLSQKLEDQLEG